MLAACLRSRQSTIAQRSSNDRFHSSPAYGLASAKAALGSRKRWIRTAVLSISVGILLPAAILVSVAFASERLVSLAVPSGIPISLDGNVTDLEWHDALTANVGEGAKLRIKHDKSDLLIGIALPAGEKRYVDVYFAKAGRPALNLHASLQQGERLLVGKWTDNEPSFDWRSSSVWQASTAPRALVEANGLNAGEVWNGYEFRIPADKIGYCPVQLRVEVRDFFGKGPDWVYPAASERSQPASWASMTRCS